MGDELERGQVAKGLMGPHRVVGVLPDTQLLVEGLYVQGEVGDLVELFGMGAIGPLDAPVELGERGGKTNRRIPRCWQAPSNTAANSLPPSTWTALRGKGERCWRVVRNAAARVAVARVCTSRTSYREITSLAVNYLRITPGTGRRSIVSTWTRSPGSHTR